MIDERGDLKNYQIPIISIIFYRRSDTVTLTRFYLCFVFMSIAYCNNNIKFCTLA